MADEKISAMTTAVLAGGQVKAAGIQGGANVNVIIACIQSGDGNVHIVKNGTTALPTADPHVVGALWTNNGVLTQSAG